MNILQYLEDRSIPEPNSGCVLWLRATNQYGYGVFGKGKNARLAHRVAWSLATGHDPAGLIIRHKCDNPGCINPNHLEAGTHLDNMRDMMRRGRHVSHSGEKHALSKLADTQIRAILADRRSPTLVARHYGISPSYVCDLRAGRRRKTSNYFT